MRNYLYDNKNVSMKRFVHLLNFFSYLYIFQYHEFLFYTFSPRFNTRRNDNNFPLARNTLLKFKGTNLASRPNCLTRLHIGNLISRPKLWLVDICQEHNAVSHAVSSRVRTICRYKFELINIYKIRRY